MLKLEEMIHKILIFVYNIRYEIKLMMCRQFEIVDQDYSFFGSEFSMNWILFSWKETTKTIFRSLNLWNEAILFQWKYLNHNWIENKNQKIVGK